MDIIRFSYLFKVMNEFSGVSVTSTNVAVGFIIRAVAGMNKNLVRKGSKHMVGVASSIDESESGCR